MKRIRPVFRALFFPLLLLSWGNTAFAAESLDFAIIQPGQPGTSREAQPVMDALAAYLEKKMGPGVTINGRYFNELDQAVSFLEASPPSWAIVRIGFFMEQASRFQMRPIASTLPGGYGKDIWRLVVKRDVSADWETLTGKVFGNMLFESHAAACLLFGKSPSQLPFRLKGTFRLLRSLRKVIRGRAAGAVLDRVQYESLKALALFKEVKTIHQSEELPTSPVVWLGAPRKSRDLLAATLSGMKEDKYAQTLLKLLQTDGFGPPDSTLSAFRGIRKGIDCPP